MRPRWFELTMALFVASLQSTVAVGQAVPTPASTTAAATASTDPLPPGPEHDLMVHVCSSCHAPQIAAQQRLDPAGWHDLVQQMAERGANATDPQLAQITAYLARSFPAK